MNHRENYTVDNRLLGASDSKQSAQKRERWYCFSYFFAEDMVVFPAV